MELISRDEAIKMLKDEIIIADLNEAIEVIERVPSQFVEVNNVMFGKVFQNSFITFLSTDTFDAVMKKVTRPKGKWIDYSHAIGDRFKCSNCEQIRDYKYNYCPNCGAEMEEK